MSAGMQSIEVIDTHTGGEPTRVIVDSSIALVGKTMAERKEDFRQRFDSYRKASICEPRGNDVIVGALLTAPVHPDSEAGIIFFNNVGYLGMCGHGTIGVAIALQYLGRIGNGLTKFDTPVGTVAVDVAPGNRVTIENVPSFRHQANIEVELGERSPISGDVAWGGKWFFISKDHGATIHVDNIANLTELSIQIRKQLEKNGVTGTDGAFIDHIELIGPSDLAGTSSKNFVLCPGSAYDRSPCGTGTSAKIACMAAEGSLEPGQIILQESIVGSTFEASFKHAQEPATHPKSRSGPVVIPTITGTAFVNASSKLLLDPNDPFCMGIN